MMTIRSVSVAVAHTTCTGRSSTPPSFGRGRLGSDSHRVSLRVSLRWHRTKTDANRRKPAKEDENAKLLPPQGLRERVPSLLGCREIGQKKPCLPAILNPRAALR